MYWIKFCCLANVPLVINVLLNLHVYLIPTSLMFLYLFHAPSGRGLFQVGVLCRLAHPSRGWMLERNETDCDYAKETEDRWIILWKLSPISTGSSRRSNHSKPSEGQRPINKVDRTVTLWVVTFLDTLHISPSVHLLSIRHSSLVDCKCGCGKFVVLSFTESCSHGQLDLCVQIASKFSFYCKMFVHWMFQTAFVPPKCGHRMLLSHALHQLFFKRV